MVALVTSRMVGILSPNSVERFMGIEYGRTAQPYGKQPTKVLAADFALDIQAPQKHTLTDTHTSGTT